MCRLNHLAWVTSLFLTSWELDCVGIATLSTETWLVPFSLMETKFLPAPPTSEKTKRKRTSWVKVCEQKLYLKKERSGTFQVSNKITTVFFWLLHPLEMCLKKSTTWSKGSWKTQLGVLRLPLQKNLPNTKSCQNIMTCHSSIPQL